MLGALLLRATGRVGVALALGVAYAVSDEIHQTFVPGRAGKPLDVAIDTLGVVCGIALWQLLRSRRRRERPPSPSTSTARSATPGRSGTHGSSP